MKRISEIFRLFFYSGWWRQTLVIVALILGAAAENLSIAALWPIVSIATDQDVADQSIGRYVVAMIEGVGLSSSLGVLLLFLALFVTIKFAFSTVGLIFVGREVARVTTRLRLQLLAAIMAAKWSRILSTPAGKLAAIIGEEGTRAGKAFLAAGLFVAKLAETSAYLVGCLFISWQFSLLATGAIVALWLAADRYIRKARRVGRTKTKSMRGLSVAVVEMLTSIKILKAMNRHAYIGRMAGEHVVKLRRAVEAEVYTETALKVVQEPVLAVILIAGLYVGHAFFGLGLVEFIGSVWLLKRIADGVGAMRAAMHRMALDGGNFWALIAAKRELQEHAETLSGGLTPRLTKGCRFEAVDFAYGDVEVVGGASFELPAGEISTLIGPSGAGKTTLIDLLIGLHRPSAGAIKIDGVDLRDIDMAKWRERLGYIPQDTILFNDTVARNVTLGEPDIPPEAVERALRLAGAWEFVCALPKGVEETIGVRGNLLSGGQKQRLAIARALVHEPDLLILDEATSALDFGTASEICSAVRGLKGDHTVVSVTHQSVWNEVADNVFRVRGGRVQHMQAH
jgi:ATP-binding cassette subfamily C protein